MSSIDLIEADAPTAVSTITRAIAIPAIGTHWVEHGGIFAGIVRGENGAADRALIISLADAGGEFESAQWGEYGKDVPGARSRDGLANTRAMSEAGSEIAQKVLALTIGGVTDWHIGSQAEMHVAAANVPELFEQGPWYWTSSQNSRNDAFIQDFEHGDSGWGFKDDVYRVRAVRTIQLQPLTA